METSAWAEELPGIEEDTAALLHKANVFSPQQLVGQFLQLHTVDTNVRRHCYLFWWWMHTCGIRPLQRAYIMDYVGHKACTIFPGSYDPSVFAE